MQYFWNVAKIHHTYMARDLKIQGTYLFRVMHSACNHWIVK
jgi:hypothetical protein